MSQSFSFSYVYFSSAVMRSLTPVVLHILLVEWMPLHKSNLLSPSLFHPWQRRLSHFTSLPHSISAPLRPSLLPHRTASSPESDSAPHAKTENRDPPSSVPGSPYFTGDVKMHLQSTYAWQGQLPCTFRDNHGTVAPGVPKFWNGVKKTMLASLVAHSWKDWKHWPLSHSFAWNGTFKVEERK